MRPAASDIRALARATEEVDYLLYGQVALEDPAFWRACVELGKVAAEIRRKVGYTERGNLKTVVDSDAPPADIALDRRRYWIVNWETGNCYAVGTPRGNIKTVVY